MAHKKGNSYSPNDSVADAMAKIGWKPEVFFAHAKTFTRTNGFDATAAAKAFAAGDNPPKSVVTFADWVNTREVKDIRTRFH